MSQVTEQVRQREVPDWVVREAVSIALQTSLREPILEAVEESQQGETRPESDEQPMGGGRGRRLSGLAVLAAIAVGLALAYRRRAGGE